MLLAGGTGNVEGEVGCVKVEGMFYLVMLKK